eukprot:jgi/Chrzof1/1006/Cz01g36170.t1
MAALLFKVGALMMRQISKPLGDRFKNWVMSHPEYRSRVLKMAQSLHRVEVMISRKAEGKEGRTFIGDLTEEKSVEMASKIASESFVFGVATLLIFLEYDRNRRNEIKKKRKEAAEKSSIIEQARQERERLMQENYKQHHMIEDLVLRMDKLEEAIHNMHEAKRQQRSWGGFFAPRGLQEHV